MKNNIRALREARGWSQVQLAERIGTSQTQIGRLETNSRRLSDYWMQKLCGVFSCNVTDLFALNKKTTKVVGYVGAGAEVIIVDDHAHGAGLEEVDRPLGDDLPADIVAVRVRGDSMEPQLEDGWLLFYSKTRDGVPPECVGELCIIKLQNDGMLVKKVREGSQPGFYHLLSKNPAHQPMFDQKLQWASKVLDIRPQ